MKVSYNVFSCELVLNTFIPSWTTKENILLLKWNQFGIAEKLTDTGLSAIQFCQMMYDRTFIFDVKKKEKN